MLSQGRFCGSEGIELHGQASPSEVPPMEAREDGQIGPRPSIRTSHNAGNGTTGIEEALVSGWDKR